MSDEPRPKLTDGALAAEQARLARLFETINKHRKALDLAIEQSFGGALDATEWRGAFQSREPQDTNRTIVVTGDCLAMLNTYVEIPKASAGSRLIGLLPHRRPTLNRPSAQLDRKHSLLAASPRRRHRMRSTRWRIKAHQQDGCLLDEPRVEIGLAEAGRRRMQRGIRKPQPRRPAQSVDIEARDIDGYREIVGEVEIFTLTSRAAAATCGLPRRSCAAAP